MFILRFPKYEFHKDGFVISRFYQTPRILKPIRMGNYVGLTLKRIDGHLEKAYLHRLICEAHHGPCPEGMECRHKDGDKANNAASNLAWGTSQENSADKNDHGTMLVGEKNPMSKMTEEGVREMRKYREDTGESYAKIAKRFDVSAMTAHRIINNKLWRSVK
ncbi:HNH nuclease [Sulfitobacter phage phiGT1]|nr:HNH nuclease [Sulfitobacter phage phiGT1]